MSVSGKIVGINIVLHLVAVVLINVFGRATGGEEAILGVGILLMMLVAFQALVNAIGGIAYLIKRNSQLSQSFFLSSGLILLIGFSVCYGTMMIDP